MTLRSKSLAVLVAALAATITACSGPKAADLFSVARSGNVPGAALTLVVRDDGSVTCNGVSHSLPDPLLLEARQLQRDMAKDAGARLNLPPGAQPVFRYAVRSPDGSLSFSDDSPGQHAELNTLAYLTRRVAREVCGLVR